MRITPSGRQAGIRAYSVRRVGCAGARITPSRLRSGCQRRGRLACVVHRLLTVAGAAQDLQRGPRTCFPFHCGRQKAVRSTCQRGARLYRRAWPLNGVWAKPLRKRAQTRLGIITALALHRSAFLFFAV